MLGPSDVGGLLLVLLLGFVFCLAASQFLAAAVAELRDWLMVCFFVAMLLAPAAAAAAAAISCADNSLDLVREWSMIGTGADAVLAE
jgi:hypothetical protein